MPGPSLRTLIYEKRAGIAYVTLNRPDVMNALNKRMVDELVTVWDDVREDKEVQVVILTGAGKAFMQGRGDVEKIRRSLDAPAPPPARPFRHSWNTPVSPKAHDVFKPVIAAVNGVCATSGLEQVSEADIVICSDEATFFDNHVSYGAIVHSAIALAKRVPYNHAIRMALMGEYEVVDANRALEIGLVTEVVPHERLMTRATEIAKTIMLNSPTAVQASIEILWHSLSLGLRDAMQLDSYMQRYYNYHPDLREAARAFVEGRRPAWTAASWYEGGYHRGEL
jgi:enoyl-CoA hydratase/carnithine racemase